MKKKIGESFTIERELSAGTGYSFYVTGITGGLALVESGIKSAPGHTEGGVMTQTFTFICLKEGKATYQLAKLRVFDVSTVLYEDVAAIEVEAGNNAQANNMLGGWSDTHKPDANEIKVFEEAFEGFVGVNYTPLTVKTQLVNGTNYIYTTEAKGVYPGAQSYKAQVSIYKPIHGRAVITNIVRLEN